MRGWARKPQRLFDRMQPSRGLRAAGRVYFSFGDSKEHPPLSSSFLGACGPAAPVPAMSLSVTTRTAVLGFLVWPLFLTFIYLWLRWVSVAVRGLSPALEWGLLNAVASLVAEHRLRGTEASGAVAHRLSCSAACGVFPQWGSDLCPPHRQAES